MGCGSAKISQSSATHVADEESDADWDSSSSQPAAAASTSGQQTIHRIISSHSQFSTVTAISNTSRIRVTLSRDGSLLQIETENLSVGASSCEGATSEDLMDITELEDRGNASSDSDTNAPTHTVHSALVTSESGHTGVAQSPDHSSSAFSDLPSSTSSHCNCIVTNSPHIDTESIKNSPGQDIVTVHRQHSCDSTMNGPCESLVCHSVHSESPSASTVTTRPTVISAGGSLDRVLENCENSFFRDPITSPCSEDGLSNTRVFSDPALLSQHSNSSCKETKSSKSIFGQNTVPRSASNQSNIHRQSTLPTLRTAKSKGLPTSVSLGSLAKLRQAFASAISSSRDREDMKSPTESSSKSRSRKKLLHANTITNLHLSNGPQVNGGPPQILNEGPQMNGPTQCNGGTVMVNGTTPSGAKAKMSELKVKSSCSSLLASPSTEPKDQGVTPGEHFSTVYNDVSETEATFLALYVHQDFFNDFEDLFDTDAPYLSCHQDNDLELKT